MTNTSTTAGQADNYPHHIWCARHDDGGSTDSLMHFSDSELVDYDTGRESGQAEVSLERTTHLDVTSNDHEPEPAIFLAVEKDGPGIRLTLNQARNLREALGRLIELGEQPEIPAGVAYDGWLSPLCPPWCLEKDHEEKGYSHAARHVSKSFGPDNWFVRMSEPIWRGTHPTSVKIELMEGDDPPMTVEPPTARSIAAALIHVADLAEQ